MTPRDDIMSSPFMHVISKKRLREFWDEHASAEVALRRWYKVVSHARWEQWSDVKATFSSADQVKVASGTPMVVFNVGGNNYRVVTRALFEFGRVYIKRVMTHAEYGKGRWKGDL